VSQWLEHTACGSSSRFVFPRRMVGGGGGGGEREGGRYDYIN